DFEAAQLSRAGRRESRRPVHKALLSVLADGVLGLVGGLLQIGLGLIAPALALELAVVGLLAELRLGLAGDLFGLVPHLVLIVHCALLSFIRAVSRGGGSDARVPVCPGSHDGVVRGLVGQCRASRPTASRSRRTEGSRLGSSPARDSIRSLSASAMTLSFSWAAS